MNAAVDISAAFRSLLLASQDLVSKTNERIFADFLPQSMTPPAIVFWVVSETANESLSGPTGLDLATFQINAYGTRDEANEIAWLVWNHAGGFFGEIDGVHVLSVTRRTGVRYTQDRAEAGSDARRFIASQDLQVSYHSK